LIRKIIHIDEDKCNGCGACVTACHEGAIQMVDGKAKLTREDYCDGLGDCLPACPTGAITFEEREAPAFDAAAVAAAKSAGAEAPLPCGCPGMHSRPIERKADRAPEAAAEAPDSHLGQWPVQIKLAPVNAPYFKNANLLIAADCTAYAYGDFHRRFMKNQVTLIGCPKLDSGDYADKLTEILKVNDIRRITVVRMEVPCCSGIVRAVTDALRRSGKFIPWQVVTLSVGGEIIDE
jgi:NAD-dependent dihydropyrimidine dehydrogenase PreA subunit